MTAPALRVEFIDRRTLPQWLPSAFGNQTRTVSRFVNRARERADRCAERRRAMRPHATVVAMLHRLRSVQMDKTRGRDPPHLRPRLRRAMRDHMRRLVRPRSPPPLRTLRPVLDRSSARSQSDCSFWLAAKLEGRRLARKHSITPGALDGLPWPSSPRQCPCCARRVRPHRRARRLDLDLDRRAGKLGRSTRRGMGV